MSGQKGSASVLEGLAALLARQTGPGEAARAAWHLADWLGCAIAGSREPAGRILLQQGGGPGGRAFAWGGLGNILEMDDVDKRALLHPGPVIIPAALALAAEKELPLDALEAALVRGYEATIRLGRAVGREHYAFFHNTGTCGAIGAAAACASLLGLDEARTAHALSLAVSQSAGLWQTRHEPQSMGKQLHTAHAARAGYDAARLAAAGFNGPLTLLEGEQGFFRAMCPGADPYAVLEKGRTWRLHDVSFKPWPACRHAHAAIDAALLLRDAIDPSNAEEIVVSTFSDALRFCDRPRPKTAIEAKFSLQHAVAVTLLRGAPVLDDFSTAAIEDGNVAALRERISVWRDPVLDSAYPARFGACVAWGQRSRIVADALGDPENPIGEEALLAKAIMLGKAGGLDPGRAEEAFRSVLTRTMPPRSLALFLEKTVQ